MKTAIPVPNVARISRHRSRQARPQHLAYRGARRSRSANARSVYGEEREGMKVKVAGDGTKAKPWNLKTPSGSSDYEMYRAEDADPPTIVCVVGKTELRYHLRADMPPLLEALGLAEVEHNPKNNRMRAL